MFREANSCLSVKLFVNFPKLNMSLRQKSFLQIEKAGKQFSRKLPIGL
jgi:hypothetical protein